MTVMATENRKSAFEKVRDAMAAQTAAQSSESLCIALLAIDGPNLDEPERIVRAILEEELWNRHPEVDAASLRWSEDPEATESHSEVIVAAVLKALENDGH
jgi:hypothetical protein